jgi:hypothetical protein
MIDKEDIVLRKAEAVIDVICEFDEENSNPNFQEVLDAVLNKWREFN